MPIKACTYIVVPQQKCELKLKYVETNDNGYN